jgi:hypothetical protein
VGILTRLLAFGFVAAASAAATIAATPTESQLKAVFLFNFAQFVEWPPAAFETADTPFTICVLGKDPFGADLDEAVRGERVLGRPFAVKRHSQIELVGTCHILFVADADTRHVLPLLPSLRSTLVVSDAVQPGVMIGFLKQRHRIRLQINLAAANQAGLSVSSKLLRIADVLPADG